MLRTRTIVALGAATALTFGAVTYPMVATQTSALALSTFGKLGALTLGVHTIDPSRGIVFIATTLPNGEAAGTGMVLTADGRILTNYHVVEGSTSIEVTVVATGETYTATVVGHDAARDVALLQADGASGLATITPDDDPLSVGDALTVVGNAQGERQLVTATGVVTALDQSVTVSGNDGDEHLAGVIVSDAAAQPGDSGGPTYDAEGEVTGMTTAGGQRIVAGPGRRGSTPEVVSTSFAVPISDALAVVQQIVAGDESGTVQIGPRAQLGITVTGGRPTVAQVLADGPADAAGITAGSTLTSLNGTSLNGRDQLSDLLSALEPGDTVAVTWVSMDGVAHTGQVTLGASSIN